MTKTEELQAVCTGSFILSLYPFLSKDDFIKGSVVRLRQSLSGKLRHASKDIAKVADEAYERVKEYHRDRKTPIDIGVIFESLTFGNEEAMKKYYGGNILNLAERACSKIVVHGTTPEIQKATYSIADEMKASIQKSVYDYLKGE